MGLALVIIFITATIGGYFGAYLKEITDNIIMRARMRENSRYLRAKREGRDEYVKRRWGRKPR